VLQACVIHLVSLKTNSGNEDSRGQIEQGIRDLEEMGRCHGFAERGIEVVRFLAGRWGVGVNVGVGDGKREGDGEGLDLFSADVRLLDGVQRVEGMAKREGEEGVNLFSPFPLQGLPFLRLGGGLEREGFKMRGS